MKKFKQYLKIFLLVMFFGLILTISVEIVKIVNKKIQHYQDVERFDQIKNILMKGNKVNL